MKNHMMMDGQLLQANKKYSALKESQKQRIADWAYAAYRKCYMESGKLPDNRRDEEILDYVLGKIKEAGIWIPEGEIYRYYSSRKNKLINRLKKEFAAEFEPESHEIPSDGM